MLIYISIDNIWTIDDLRKVLNVKKFYISNNTIWYEGFYIKLLKNLLEINIFDKTLTEKYILNNLMRPILNRKEKTFIRIQKGRIITQFVLNKNEEMDEVYN